MKTFRHSGKIGDIIFSLPTIKALGGGAVHIPETTGECERLYSQVKALLLAQSYIHEVHEYPSRLPYMQLAPGIHIDYDLDRARLQPGKGVVHVVKRYMDQFGISLDNWKDPWLSLNVPQGDYTVINYTGRHIKNNQTGQVCKTNWAKVVQGIEGIKYFVGTKDEYKEFTRIAGDIDYLHTRNILQLAEVIAGAKAVYCNQSSTLALSQALGKEYWCSFKPGKQNCKLKTDKEHEI